MSVEEEQAVVIDSGSGYTKAGFSGDDAPRYVDRTVVATRINESTSSKYGLKREKIVGANALKYQDGSDSAVTVAFPVEHGKVVDWGSMEKMLHHIFYNELRIAPKEHSVLITESSLTPKANREKMIQILFETFNAPAFFTSQQPVLALYASGRTTGLVVDSGYQQTQCVPIYEGYALPHATRMYGIGGQTIDRYLQRLIAAKYACEVPLEHVLMVKKHLCCVAERGLADEMQKPLCLKPDWLVAAYLRDINGSYAERTSMEIEKSLHEYCGDKNAFLRSQRKYQLPDGKTICLDKELLMSAEIMFDPSPVALTNNSELHETDGVHVAVYDSLLKCDVDIKRDLLDNCVLAGGNSMLNGFAERFKHEWYRQAKLATQGSVVGKVIVHPERTYMAWIGGSILSSLSTFQDMWITRDEYGSSGPGIVHRKCF